MASPMRRVNEVVSSSMGNYLTNFKSWNPVTYNVLEFGVVGGGVIDDTSALQKLVDLAISEGRKAIYFPHGEYYVTSLTGDDQVVFFGDNASFVGGYTGIIYQMGDWATNEQLADIAVFMNDARFGAVGDGIADDTVAVQAVIDYATANKRSVIIPYGYNFLINGDIWVTDDTSISGYGDKSQLTFASGRLRAEKGGQRGFAFVDVYTSDIIPAGAGDYTSVTLTANASIGSSTLSVSDTSQVQVGDVIYTFNGVTDAWAILENSAESAKWNDPVNYPLAQMEIFTVKSKTSTTITLDKQTLFALPSGTPVKKIVGSSRVTLMDFRMDFTGGQTYGCVFEQVNNSTFSDLIINGGGIHFFNKSFKNTISSCLITTTTARSLTIDSFSSLNAISDNTIQYSHGGDSAIIVMMSNSNTVKGNTITGSGTQTRDEGGITIHARSYGNTVNGNVVKNCTASYSFYYGAFNNTISGNTSIGTPLHLYAHYAYTNTFKNNSTYGNGRAGGGVTQHSLLIFNSVNIDAANNTLCELVVLQSSRQCKIESNSIESATLGINLLGDNSIAEHYIATNKIKAPIGIQITTATYLVWDGVLSTRIEGNIFDCSNRGVDLNWLSYVNIIGNVFKNSADGVYLRDLAVFSKIQRNEFISCTRGINFLSETQSSYSSVSDNTFYKVATPINGWMTPAFNVAGGMYGFTIYDLDAMPNNKRWVYNNITTGLTGSGNWTAFT